tara:strand:+ start:333 stop:1517 length:1185 start_codon:yes stop_codon:yes gene_type:complete
MDIHVGGLGLVVSCVIVAFIFWNLGAKSEKKLREQQRESAETELRKDLIVRLDTLKSESVLLPSLGRWAGQIDELFGEFDARLLRIKKRPALRAAEQVTAAKKETREVKFDYEIARNRVDLYESLAPWLVDYTDLSLDELINAIKEEKDQKSSAGDNEDDPVTQYVPKSGTEWKKLSPAKRNQLALDRYSDPHRKRSLWRIGIDFERYVGYHYEYNGYKVRFYGALQGREDLGIDLLCENENEILVVQCKRLSIKKGLPVRENSIAQIYGAAKFFETNPQNVLKRLNLRTRTFDSIQMVKPVMITSYELSSDARLFAKTLGVEVIERFEVGAYPMIKCNIAPRDGEKIYHLPMDQQYDKVVIGDRPGERYVETVAEAERLGFRRAYRWQGDGVE